MRLVTIGIGILCLTPIGLFSQGMSTGQQSLPPGLVDGSKNPERIPDHASYRLILIHLSSLNSSEPKGAARQAALFKQIGLSAADAQVLKDQVAVFSATYSEWQARSNVSPSAAAEQEARAIALATRDNLLKGLSPDGVGKLVKYVEQEKAHMVVRP